MQNLFIITIILIASIVWAEEKLPVPSQDKQTEAEALVRDIFKADYSKAKTAAEKLALAQKLLEQGLATKDDPVGRYVLLRDARDLAVEVGSVGVCLDAIEAVSEQFEIDFKKLIVEKLVKITNVTKPVAGNKQDLVRVMEIIEEAVEDDDFGYAIGLAPVASFVAKNTGGESVKTIAIRVAEIESIQKAFVAVRVARQKLETAADNPEANLIDGRYLCFLKGDWDAGLKRLTKSSDVTLKVLAERDLADPTTASDQVVVGDGWWSFVEKEEGLAKARLALRAKEWYGRAEKGLTGLTAAKVKKRLEGVGAMLEGTSVADVSEAPLVATLPKDAPPPAIAPFDAAQAKKHQEAWAKYLKLPVTVENSIGMKLKLIPPGEFLMGSPEGEAGRKEDEGPQHKVRITKPFYMGVTEVTQAEYLHFMPVNPSGFKGAKNPVETVRWDDASEFCKRLTASKKERAAGRLYRLPTEAEWEYACRAGATTVYSFGDDERRLGEYSWFEANSGKQSHPVGKLKPNAFGLFDMHGNVNEHCVDWGGTYPTETTINPVGLFPSRAHPNGLYHINRGGDWLRGYAFCRCSDRGHLDPINRFNNCGFRVVVEYLEKVKLEIIKAEYGAGANQKDVTNVLQKHATDALRISTDALQIFLPMYSYNDCFAGDPALGSQKQLKVRYKINGKDGSATFTEDGLIMLPVPQ